jgi:uncharacterized protein
VSSSTILTLPGLFGSGPEHWQTRWETRFGYERVEQADWEQPEIGAWIERLSERLARATEPVVLVAHSLGAALAVHAARTLHAKIASALLVAPADVEDPQRTPAVTHNFAPLPRAPLGFRALVVASSNDPYISLERAASWADAWQAQFVNAGPLGHINAQSGLGDWPEGLRMLQTIQQP